MIVGNISILVHSINKRAQSTFYLTKINQIYKRITSRRKQHAILPARHLMDNMVRDSHPNDQPCLNQAVAKPISKQFLLLPGLLQYIFSRYPAAGNLLHLFVKRTEWSS